jgi:hypothetical protein
MIEQDHPVIPPLDLLKRWESRFFDDGENYDVMLIEAYQAGADRELGECCKWIANRPKNWETTASELSHDLGVARRPKKLSVKEQALLILDDIDAELGAIHCNILRRALEALPND